LAEFVAFLTDIVINQPRGKEIHVIADNLSAHNSAPVKECLEAHPKVQLHFTPTYSSWLNQVELWFGKIERDVIAGGVFTSVFDLKLSRRLYRGAGGSTPKLVPARPLPDWARVREELMRNSRDVGPRFTACRSSS
jgi:hypothetical protein